MKKMSKVVSLMLVLIFVFSALAIPAIEARAADGKIPADEVYCVKSSKYCLSKKTWVNHNDMSQYYYKRTDRYVRKYSDGSTWWITVTKKYLVNGWVEIPEDLDEKTIFHGTKKLIKKVRKTKCRVKGNSDFKP